jgi:DNA-binding transcriptional LysR family regulator
MDFHRLRYFIAVAEAEHFHHAADRLHVAQPALSRQVKLLEEELGVALFERLGRGVRLTEAGRVFLADTKRALLELDRAREHARQVADGRAGTLRICFIEIASGHGVLPDTIRAFRSSHPNVRLVLQPLDSLAQLTGLQEGKIDVAFLYRGRTVANGLVSRPIHSEDFVLALPAGHRFAQAPEVRLSDLQNEPFIWSDRSLNPEFDNALMSACLERGLVPHIVQETSSSAHIVSLVAVGIGVGLVPASARWRLQQGVVLRPVTDLELKFQIDITWRDDNRSAPLRHFTELAFRIAREDEYLRSSDETATAVRSS